jgi:hypothetical protein
VRQPIDAHSPIPGSVIVIHAEDGSSRSVEQGSHQLSGRAEGRIFGPHGHSKHQFYRGHYRIFGPPEPCRWADF